MSDICLDGNLHHVDLRDEAIWTLFIEFMKEHDLWFDGYVGVIADDGGWVASGTGKWPEEEFGRD